MAKKKSPTRRSAASTKVRRGKSANKGAVIATGLGRYGLPLLISGVLLAGLIILTLTFYRTATSSDFFRARSVEIRGNEHTSAEDIRRLVLSDVEKTGVWNADIAELKAKLEKFPYVKIASVSRQLPASIRVDITERVPMALVHMSSGNYIVDADGAVLEKAAPNDQRFPFAMYGWDENKTEKAIPDNQARLKVYRKMLDEWKQFDLESRVKQVDVSSIREPIAIVEDSGHPISITLARDNLGKSLKTAIEAVSGKGSKVKSVDSEGVSPVITYLDF